MNIGLYFFTPSSKLEKYLGSTRFFVKMKHRPVFGRTQQGGFLSDAASNYRQTVNRKKNLSYPREGSACLCSHDLFPSDAAALVSNWKAACCSFSNWTAPQTSPAPLPSLVCLASKTRRLGLPHPRTPSGYLSLRRRASGEPHFLLPSSARLKGGEMQLDEL